MLYDSTPQYEHFAHLPYAKEPYKAIYVFQRLLTTLLLVPYWFVKYLILPRRYRPRQSWSLRQIIFVNFTRRIYRVTEVAGVNWGTRDPDADGSKEGLKETRFEWAEPLRKELRRGVVVDRFGKVPFKRVGCFVWPRERKAGLMSPRSQADNDDDDVPIVGIFMHGGGYCQMSASEKVRTAHIPRRLINDNLLHECYAVEYRLLQHAPLPAVIIDAATVYAHVIDKYYAGSYTPETKKRVKIVLIGDSSGGNLVLALARWIRDEGIETGLVPMPDGLLLFSPSCDASHAFPPSPSTWHTPRPNADTDYLTDTPEPRLLLQKTFLGFKHQIEQNDIDQRRLFFLSGMGNVVGDVYNLGRTGVGSVYNLGRTGVGSVVNLLRGGGSAASTPQILNSTPAFVGGGGGSTPQLASTIPTAADDDDAHNKRHPTDKEMEQDTLLQQIIHSEYVSPASPVVLKRWGHPVDLYDGGWTCGCLATAEEGEREAGCEDVCGKQRPGWRPHPTPTPSTVVLPLSLSRGNESFVTDTDGTGSPEVAFKIMGGVRDRDGGRSRSSSASVEMLPPPPPPPAAQEDIRLSTLSAPHPQHPQPQTQQTPRITITPSPPSPTPSSSSSPTLAPLGRKHRQLRTRANDTLHLQDQEHQLHESYRDRYPRWGKLFEAFPRTLILCGDAERLTVEVRNLVRGMERDISPSSGEEGKRKVRIRWIPDAVHDVFIIPPGWWDENVRREAWEEVRGWVKEVREARD